MRPIRGIDDLGMLRVTGQPNLNLSVNRESAARFQMNVADVQDAIQTAVGGNAVSQVLQGEQRYDLVARYLPRYRDTREAIEHIRLLSPSGERVSLAQLCTFNMADGASTLYREANSRYVAVKYSVRGRDLGGTVEEAIRKVNAQVKLPPRYTFEWAGEYESQKRSEARLLIIVPLTVFLIFLIIYGAFGSAKWACLHLVNVAVARVGGLLALYLTGTHFSVSSGVGFLALFGASVQTGVIMVEYINQLRAQGLPADQAAIEGAVRRLRPIMMTMLVATLGLLPAALSHDIGSDSQRPFAIVIVGGLTVDLIMSTFLLPTFYAWWARPTDRLPRDRRDWHDASPGTDETGMSFRRRLPETRCQPRLSPDLPGTTVPPPGFLGCFSVGHRCPRLIRVIRGVSRCELRSLLTEIFLIDDPRLIHHERHNSGGAVVGRPCDHRESLSHRAVIQITHLTARGVRSLARQDPEVIAMIRIVLIGISLGERLRDDFANRTFVVFTLAFPVQAIFLSGCTDDLLCVDGNVGGSPVLCRVLILRFHEPAANLDRVQLVTPDPPRQDLLLALRRIEVPLAVALDNRNRHRPLVLARQQRLRCRAAVHRHQSDLLCGARRKGAPDRPVLHRITGGHNRLCRWTQNRD